MLLLEGVSVKYREYTAIKQVSFRVGRGEVYALLGPSGCGKTTLLYAIARLVSPAEGRIVIDDSLRALSLMPQHFGLLPWKRCIDNVALNMIIKGHDKREARFKAKELLEKMGLERVMYKYPPQISGGQQQRVALARSLVLRTDLLLMDEPFSSLDQLTREELQQYFADLQRNLKFSAIVVTHSIEEAAFLGKKILIMDGSPGSIKRCLDNPLWNMPNRRKSPLFYEVCRDIRGCLER